MDVLYSTENYTQYLVITCHGRECKKKNKYIRKKNVYIYICESLCCTFETNTHCKLTTFRLKKFFLNVFI